MGTARELFDAFQTDPARKLTAAEANALDAELFPEDSFARLRRAADLLSLAAQTGLMMRPVASELFRGQTGFNHLVVDVLEDAAWTARLPGHASAVERRLGAFVALAVDPPRARAGASGAVVRGLKRAGAWSASQLQSDTFTLLRASNRSLVEALKVPGNPLGWERAEADASQLVGLGSLLSAWFDAQAHFVDSVARFVTIRGGALTGFTEAAPVSGPVTGSGVSILIVGEATAQCEASLPAGCEVLRGGEAGAATSPLLIRLPGDEALLPGAVERFAEAGAKGAELVYGDTRRDDLGFTVRRPGWSPDYFSSENALGGCFAIRTATARAHELTAATPVRHWLQRPGFAFEAVARIPHALSRRGEEEAGAPRSAPPLVTRPLVSLVIPFKDRVELLEKLWASLLQFDPGLPFELVLISNRSKEEATFTFLRGLRDPRVTWFESNEPFNWSALNNAALRRTNGELVLFLNNDMELLHDGWLARLAAWANVPGVGVVGARLLYPDRSVQHAGVVVGLRGLAGHPFARWRPEYGSTPFGSPLATRNWSAVTGACLMIRRKLFEQLGGFDERLKISGGDVELCLRVRRSSLRVICAGDVELLHHESVSRRTDPVPAEDVWREFAAYRRLLEQGDPYWHPELSSEVGHGGPAGAHLEPREHAVRAVLPWVERT